MINSAYLLSLAVVFSAALILVLRREIRRSADGALPYASFFLIYSLVFYALVPAGIDLWRYHDDVLVVNHPFPRSVAVGTLLLVGGYVAGHLAGYISASRLVFSGAQPSSSPDSRDSHVTLVVFASVCIFISFVIHASTGFGIPGIVQLEQPLWRCGFACMCWLAISGRLNRRTILALILTFVVKSVVNLNSGLLTSTLFDIMIVLAVLLYFRKFKYLPVLAASFLIVLMGYQNIKCIHLNTRAPDLPENVGYGACFSVQIKNSLMSVARRSTHLQLLEHVIEKTPDTAATDFTAPALRAITNHVPRIIWPGKPREDLGGKFGKKYGIISMSDDRTSWNIPWISDFYIAGRTVAVIGYGILSGILIGAGVGWMSRHREKAFGFGLYAASLFPLFYQESNFSLMTGSILWIVAFTFALFYLTRGAVGLLQSAGTVQR